MQRGVAVRVMLPSGNHVTMRFWDTSGSNVLVCTPDAYEAAMKSGVKPRTIEYREWGVRIAPQDNARGRTSARSR